MKQQRRNKPRDNDLKARPQINVRAERRSVVAFSVAIFLVTLAVYRPAWHGELLWDDDAHITRTELHSVEGLGQIWFEPGATQQYYPLLHSAFWLQYRLWGDDTLGYHLATIVLHALCAVLIVLILKRLKIPGAYLAGTIFALHPVHVESVAWMTELKNTLSGTLCLGAALAYLRFDDGRRRNMYLLALGLFVLALLSKTVTATLPAALLVVFWWQRGRLGWQRDVLPLSPFVVLGVAGGLFTAWVERTYIGAGGAEFDFTFVERCLIAGRVIWFYLGKLFWPADLIFIYPRWQISQAVWWQYLYPLAAIAVLVSLWLVRKRTRAPLAAMLVFCGTLFPALGFFNVYPFRFSFVADHFQYLASLGIIALFSAAAALLVQRRRLRPGAIPWAITLVLALVLGVRTRQQTRIYADAVTLYTATLEDHPDCWMAHNNLGLALVELEQFEEATTHYRAAVRIKQNFAKAHNNLGLALAKLEQFEEAITHYHEALRIKPDYARAHNNLGDALAKLEQFEEAITHYRQAVQIDRDFAKAHNNWGNALQALGRFEDAVAHYQQSLRIKPDYAAEAHCNWGNALVAWGRPREAVVHYQQSLRIDPDFTEAHNNLAWLRATSADETIRDGPQALKHARRALELAGDDDATILDSLSAACAEMGDFRQAVRWQEEAIRVAGDEMKNDLAARLQLYKQGRPYRESD